MVGYGWFWQLFLAKQSCRFGRLGYLTQIKLSHKQKYLPKIPAQKIVIIIKTIIINHPAVKNLERQPSWQVIQQLNLNKLSIPTIYLIRNEEFQNNKTKKLKSKKTYRIRNIN